MKTSIAYSVAIALALVGCGHKEESTPVPAAAPSQAPSEQRPAPNPLKNAYFGDLHLHTSMSFDAYTFKTNTLPEDSYRFAQGEPVDYIGQTMQRHAPLDFLAVTDHSEYLGVMRLAGDPKGPFANTDWPRLLASTNRQELFATMMRVGAAFRGEGPKIDEFATDELVKSNWQRQIDAAEKYYKPGKFTTFVGYEWSSFPGGVNLHRNVIFKGPKYPERPFTSIDSLHPEDLWIYADNNRTQGIDTVLIPHNSNASDGQMFAYTSSAGTPITREYAEARARNERLVEISQFKGTSETRPELSPNDEFVNFELTDKLLTVNRKSKPEGSYVRNAYARGMEIASRVGVNPFQLGVVGSTDFHSGITANEENNFPGGSGASDDHRNVPAVLAEDDGKSSLPPLILSAAGLAGVWAEENTRESIFAAFKRRETFGTSGDRIKARLFAGWDYTPDLTKKPDWVAEAYAKGVAMGSDLPLSAGAAKAPTLLVNAIKDPDTGNLDRIQIVKVWFKGGKSHEKVFDAVWAGDRKPDPKSGKLPAIGDTVDLKTATYGNTIGAAELVGEWTDPEFDASAAATYYARVLAIPTPRWSTYLAVKNNLPLPKGVPPTIQERAWTSPVFYTPK